MARLLRKGQGSGLEISVLVILIAFFILIYVILLPPEERSTLLNETATGIDALPSGARAILSESPGMVYSYSKNIQTAKIEPVSLYSKEAKDSTVLAKSLTISRSILKDNLKNIIFSIDDMSNLNDVKLFMLISEGRGTMTIRLNGHVIYQGIITADQLPITLPKEYLKPSNSLEFSLNLPPFLKFYTSNYYILQDVSVIKESAKKNTEATRQFFIDMDEGQAVKSAKLHYILSCNKLEPRGTLTIKLNGNTQSRDTVFCEYNDEIVLPLEEDDLSEDGKNRLDFMIDVGDYSLDQARVVSELGKSVYPKYAFDISTDDYAGIRDGSKKLVLRFAFSDTGRKKATLYMQDSQFSFDTSAKDYSKDISGLIDEGANYIKIVPKENFEITSLKISVENA